MKVVFASNVLLDTDQLIHPSSLQPHLGLISLVSVLENRGHEGVLYDPMLPMYFKNLRLDGGFYRNVATQILDQKPDVVGFTALGCNFICVVKIASYLKLAVPDLPILLGGPHASVLHTEIARSFPQFDVIVRHEAEETLVPTLDALSTGRFEGIPGITWRRDGEVHANSGKPTIEDLDALPFPAYHSYPIEELGLDSIRVEAGRGCPFKCTFCSTATFFGRTFRLKSAERLCAELDTLNRIYGISEFSLQHDLFTVNRKKIVEFCNVVRDRGYRWSCSARADCVDPGLLELMRSAGCRGMYFGIEAGSRRMQQATEKKLDLDLVLPILDVATGLEMSCVASFITGYPQEEKADQDETLNLIATCYEKYSSGMTVQLHLLTPEPGTKMLEDFRDQLSFDEHVSDFNFPPIEDDDPWIMKENREVFVNHHFYNSTLPRERHIFVTSVFPQLHKFGHVFLTHVLTYFEGKLSELMDALFDWAARDAKHVPIDEQGIVSFLRDRFGSTHYLSSLARYLFASYHMREAAAPDGFELAEGDFERCEELTLSPNCAILYELHDCPTALAELERNHPANHPQILSHLPDTLRTYLLFLPDPSDQFARNFRIDDVTAAFLESLVTPRTPEMIIDRMEELGLDSDDGSTLIRQLISERVVLECRKTVREALEPVRDDFKLLGVSPALSGQERFEPAASQ